MAELTFDEDDGGGNRGGPTGSRYSSDRDSGGGYGGLTKFLVRNHIARDERQAQYMLLVLVLVCFTATIWIWMSINGPKKQSDLIQLPNGSKIPVTDYINGVKQGIYR